MVIHEETEKTSVRATVLQCLDDILITGSQRSVRFLKHPPVQISAYTIRDNLIRIDVLEKGKKGGEKDAGSE